jgi:cytosine permease
MASAADNDDKTHEDESSRLLDCQIGDVHEYEPSFTATEVEDISTTSVSAPSLSRNTVPWFRVALVFITASFSLPTLVAGIDLFNTTYNSGNSPRSALTAIVAGNLLLAVLSSLCGTVGARTRLHSYHLANRAFGIQGAACLNLVFATSLLGWYVVNLNILEESLQEIWSSSTREGESIVMISLASGCIFTLTAMFGFQALEKLSLLLAPMLAFVIIFLAAKAWHHQYYLDPQYGGGDSTSMTKIRQQDQDKAVLNMTTATTATLGQSISSVVGLTIMGSIITSDYTRFVIHWSGAIWSALLSSLIASLVELAAGWSSQVFASNNRHDLFELLQQAGLSLEVRLVLILGGCWVLNAMNLFSLSLSMEAVLYPTQLSSSNRQASTEDQCRHRRFIVIGVAGTLGTIVAVCCNLLSRFLDFLFYLSISFAPVSGVIVMDHYYNCLFSGHSSTPFSRERPAAAGYKIEALLAWAFGILFSLLVGATGIAALDAFLASALVYLVLVVFSRQSTD